MLAQHFAAEKDAVECRTTGVIDLIKDQWGDQGMQRVCLLDPKAQVELKPEDGDAFEWFLFGVGCSYPLRIQLTWVARGF